jgi:hypothetical protein
MPSYPMPDPTTADRTPLRYVLHPGYVISAYDSQEHFISGHRLAGLYGLHFASRNVICGDRRGYRDLPGDIHLYPRYDGNYRLPA